MDSNERTDNKVNNNTSGYFILEAGGLIISALGVYYQREAIMNAIGGKQKKSKEETNNKQPSTPAPPAAPPTPTRSKTQSRIREME